MPLKVHLHIYKYRYIYIAGPWARIFLTNKTQRCIYIYIEIHTHIYIYHIYIHTHICISVYFSVENWKFGSRHAWKEMLLHTQWCCTLSSILSWQQLGCTLSCHAGVVFWFPSGVLVFVWRLWRCRFRLALSFSCGVSVFVRRSRFCVAFPFSSSGFLFLQILLQSYN